MTPEAQELLESLLQHLLPTPMVSPPKATPIPLELELLIQCLMGNDRPVQSAQTRRSSFTDMEIQNTEFTSGRAACAGTANTGVWTPGLVDCGVFLVRQTGSRGSPVSRSGCYVSFSATGMAGREGGRRFCYAVTPVSGRTTPDGKR